tara:strand:+ start:23890 stop:24309 length:420 start_codon:yes stop_codon:yes gene_type:complete
MKHLSPTAKDLKTAILSISKADKKVTELTSESLVKDKGNTILDVAQYFYMEQGSKSTGLNTLQRTLKRITSSEDYEGKSVKLKLSDRKTGEYIFVDNVKREKVVDTIEQIQKLLEKQTDLSDKQVQAIGKGLEKAMQIA